MSFASIESKHDQRNNAFLQCHSPFTGTTGGVYLFKGDTLVPGSFPGVWSQVAVQAGEPKFELSGTPVPSGGGGTPVCQDRGTQWPGLGTST